MRAICRQQLFCSLRPHHHMLYQKKILNDQNAQNTATGVRIAYHFWLPFSINSAQLKKVNKGNIRAICRQQLFCSLGAHQHSSDQKKIVRDQSAQTTARVVSVTYCLWLTLSINKVLNLTKLRSVLYDQPVDSSCFAL